MTKECETCIKRKTLYCPTSIECMATDDMPYYQNRIMLLEENQQLKERIEYLERSNNRREDTILEQRQRLSDLEDNWNKLRTYFNKRIEVCDNRLSNPFCNFEKVTKERLIFSQCLEKLEELEQGSDSNE